MDDNGLLSALNNMTVYLEEPSTIHWLSFFLGDWVLGVFNTEAQINYPISALMVAFASLNVVALAALLIVLFFTGGRTLFSGVVTANIAAGNNKVVVFRLMLAFGLLTPTTIGIEQLEKYNVSISNVQANTARVIVAGGALADWVWHNSVQAIFDLNISGASPLRNTISRSNEFALVFACNEIYYQTIGKNKGLNRYYYASFVDGKRSIHSAAPNREGVDNFSDIPPPITGDFRPSTLVIQFGNGHCGSIKLSQIEDPNATNNPAESSQAPNIGGKFNELLPAALYQSRVEANKEFLSTLNHYEQFGKSYWENFKPITPKGVVEGMPTRGSSGETFIPMAMNIGDYAPLYPDVHGKLNGMSDSLIFLAQLLAYKQQALSVSAAQISISSFNQAGNESFESHGEQIASSTLSGFLSAPFMWGYLQDYNSVSYAAERYVNGIKVAMGDLSSGSTFCREGLISRVFFSKKVNGVEYACDAVGHMVLTFPLIEKISTSKGSNEISASTISQSFPEQKSFAVDGAYWGAFYRANNAEPSAISNLFQSSLFNMFEYAWTALSWLSWSDSTLIGEHPTGRHGLISGNDSLLFGLSGQNSPYIFLAQVGESMRDVAFNLHVVHSIIKAFDDSRNSTVGKVANTVIDNTNGLGAFIALGMEFSSNVISNLFEPLIRNLGNLILTMQSVSLILIYALPAIPVIGGVMITGGLFYTFGSAMAATPFSAVLVGLPKGEGFLSPDTERVLSLLYGIFIRQVLTVVGFVFSLYIGYALMSLFNLLWFATFISKVGALGIIDSIFALIAIVFGYGVGLFFICLYSFRVWPMLPDTVGIWFSSYLVGGAFGSNDADVTNVTNAMKTLSTQLDEYQKTANPSGGGNGGGSNAPEPPEPRKSDRKRTNA